MRAFLFVFTCLIATVAEAQGYLYRTPSGSTYDLRGSRFPSTGSSTVMNPYNGHQMRRTVTGNYLDLDTGRYTSGGTASGGGVYRSEGYRMEFDRNGRRVR